MEGGRKGEWIRGGAVDDLMSVRESSPRGVDVRRCLVRLSLCALGGRDVYPPPGADSLKGVEMASVK